MKYLKTALLVSSVALFTSCGSSIDYSGNYAVSFAATTSEDNGYPCIWENGSISINDSRLIGTIVSDWGNAYHITGDVSQNGYIRGYLKIEDNVAGPFNGQMNANGGNGTWNDIDQCSGEWIAVEED